MSIDFERPGRMISSSKREPKGHICVFNANVLTKTRGKFWWGDLDLTTDEDELKALAVKEGENVYVLRERDARFTTESDPQWQNAVGIYCPNGTVAVRDSH